MLKRNEIMKILEKQKFNSWLKQLKNMESNVFDENQEKLNCFISDLEKKCFSDLLEEDIFDDVKTFEDLKNEVDYDLKMNGLEARYKNLVEPIRWFRGEDDDYVTINNDENGFKVVNIKEFIIERLESNYTILEFLNERY